MDFKEILKQKINELMLMSKRQNKLSGFMIGNTSKKDKNKFYFTPLRETKPMILSGLIVYSEKYAKLAAKYLDGKIDYVLVDAEKKIPPKANGDPSNIERRVKEILKKTKMWIYKGNDLTIDAIDIFLTHLLKENLRGIGGKKVLIIGAGNIGFKIALQMIERGAKVFLCARNFKKLNLKVDALNLIKPIHTVEKVIPIQYKKVKNVINTLDIVIGATNGKPVITEDFLKNLKRDSILIDLGKGTFYNKALNYANQKNKKIYRVDISAALEGQINKLLMFATVKNNNFKKKKLMGTNLISSGLLGGEGDIVLDDVNKPKRILGICDGKGDFVRNLSSLQKKKLSKINRYLKIKNDFKI
tara:strand:- start:1588 stop:2661 length:1074 start_codon:yes stop_codon:yes gene_type:complete